MWQPKKLRAILSSSMKESVMVLMIIACSVLFSQMLPVALMGSALRRHAGVQRSEPIRIRRFIWP